MVNSQPTNSKNTYTIGTVGDFPPGTRLRVKIGHKTIAVFNIAGEYYAIHDRCPHQFAPLSRGRLQGTLVCNARTGWEPEWAYDGEIVVCPGHGMEFHVKTGKAIGYDLRLRTYAVIVEGGEVKIIA